MRLSPVNLKQDKHMPVCVYVCVHVLIYETSCSLCLAFYFYYIKSLLLSFFLLLLHFLFHSFHSSGNSLTFTPFLFKFLVTRSVKARFLNGWLSVLKKKNQNCLNNTHILLWWEYFTWKCLYSDSNVAFC